MAGYDKWADYKKWDDSRRYAFPTAVHWIYKSKLQGFTVAEFCSLSGSAHIEGATNDR